MNGFGVSQDKPSGWPINVFAGNSRTAWLQVATEILSNREYPERGHPARESPSLSHELLVVRECLHVLQQLLGLLQERFHALCRDRFLAEFGAF